MPELLLELFSEEIPARMQAQAAGELSRLVGDALSALAPAEVEVFAGPRRIALRAVVQAGIAASSSVERGPRAGAPEQALAGFLRKHGAAREALREEGGFWVLERAVPGQAASAMVAQVMPGVLRRFSWPKSMRWGGTSGFTWVRPLRRILCLLDGAVVPFALADGSDDGHGLAAGGLTEGHRFHAPGPFAVGSFADWRETLARNRVVAGAAERRRIVAEGLARLADARGLTVVEDAGLLDEVAGLVEWPVPLLGRIDGQFMDLPAEVMQVSLRVNQRYFVMRDAAGAAAPWFGFAANVEALDGGAAIIAGNERVLRARLSDARHFWDFDRRTRLSDRVRSLGTVTFHAKLGSQGNRAQRIGNIAYAIAQDVGLDLFGAEAASQAARLAKADLTTGMVGEFPELQGVMGGYYATHDNEEPRVANAIREHYAPRGPSDAVPVDSVSVAVALSDKLDQLVAFFAIGEKPSGSGDPFALRRAALGILRIIRENSLQDVRLPQAIDTCIAELAVQSIAIPATMKKDVLRFIEDRLRVQLRSEGIRHDIVDAVLPEDFFDLGLDIAWVAKRAADVGAFLSTSDGRDLIIAYKRAVNILEVEERRDGQAIHSGCDSMVLAQSAEKVLASALDGLDAEITADFEAIRYTEAMHKLARLRAPLDRFFDEVTVNDADPARRQNRLRLLASVRNVMNCVADFSEIEG